MLFNSVEYLIFLPTVFILYWFVLKNTIKGQNLLLFIVSYIFYGWWDWRFLSLIAFSSIIDYCCGIYIEKANTQRGKKQWLTLSMLVNLGFLGVFKYFNFFSNSLAEGFQSMGYQLDAFTLDVVLPIGISFYTFQTMSYTIDVYRGQLKPTKDIVSFFAFVSFFPQLVAGPIERATNLLPQFYTARKFDIAKAKDGLRQIAWGLFKKIVVADNCAIIANQIFDEYTTHSGSTLFLGAILFAFQIYGDFSGYSDIAIGTARLFGFNMMQNFAFPYFSRNIAEFWRRWHISLSTWFRDYVYIPLGGSRGGLSMKVRNTFIIFLVSGFWHGANWTFIIWGGLNALYFLPSLLLKKNRLYTNTVAENSFLPSIKESFQILLTFCVTCIAWVFFRAPSVTFAVDYIGGILSSSLFTVPKLGVSVLPFVLFLLIIEWLQRTQKHGLEIGNYHIPKVFRWVFYLGLVFSIFWYGAEKQEFIYFQF